MRIPRRTEVRGGADSAPGRWEGSHGQRPAFCVREAYLALGGGQSCSGHTCHLQQACSGFGDGWRLCPGGGSQVGRLTPQAGSQPQLGGRAAVRGV